jgi:glyoxylase-like metal-dependent hydrolase (beta-lactamase superfamily II)
MLIRMLIEIFTVGMLSTNCYLASSKETKEAILIDPGLDFSAEAKPILDSITNGKLTVEFIVNTHGHDDHIKGNALFQQKLNVPICIHSLDEHFIEGNKKGNSPSNMLLENASTIKFGGESPQSNAYTRTHARQHKSCWRKTCVYRRYPVCRGNRQDRFSRWFND